MAANKLAPLADSSGVTAACFLAAGGVVVATLAELPALRDRPGGSGGRQVPPRFLRHSDEQTVVGLAAVLRAMDDSALHGECYDDWGVVAAPVFPGRLGGAATFTKFREGGPAVISPHIIPQNSLHSVAGAISVGLGMHGPNFGIGGGREALGEGLTVALSLVGDANLPGLWLVLTQWTPEPVPDGRGSTLTETACLGVALALRAGAGRGAAMRITLPGGNRAGNRDTSPVAGHDAFYSDRSRTAEGQEPLTELANWLASESAGRQSARWSFGLPWGGQVELIREPSYQQAKAA